MIRVLVAYASERGGTAEIAGWVGAALRQAGTEADVRPAGEVASLDDYDAVVVGGALYEGRWHWEARRFARRHAGELEHRPVWLFSSGPLDHTAREGVIEPVPGVSKFAARLHARDHATFGGCLSPDAKGFLASKIAKRMSGDYRDRDQVAEWAAGIARELRKVAV
ncbi:flavodoxin domain-containing protein [Actinomadura sp. NAK00032]|uniref:flavodoxin domain-containing protein n=1 Tax=Actinomadura sp. NAK00032 TaxID=2742128 RepID=UPI001592833E|nr:flavodoxin domain-containing protein [Actinomadura sp. NAK00032]QKW37032.1 flavodoxin domain-containing protein [Actinomadura sp. NAK00032]